MVLHHYITIFLIIFHEKNLKHSTGSVPSLYLYLKSQSCHPKVLFLPANFAESNLSQILSIHFLAATLATPDSLGFGPSFHMKFSKDPDKPVLRFASSLHYSKHLYFQLRIPQHLMILKWRKHWLKKFMNIIVFVYS